MSFNLRVFLIVAALLALIFVLYKIRKSQIRTADGIFWFFLVLCLVMLAVFPNIAFWCSALLGIESPANFVFLVIVAILLIKEFAASVEVAKLKVKLSQLAQDKALERNTTSDTADKSITADNTKEK